MSTDSEHLLDAANDTTIPRKLVLVTGAGRSGTSTVAGALHHLGLYVPLPVLNANESNPRGFFESKWPLKFHKNMLARAAVDPFDARPEALGQMTEAVEERDRAKLQAWLHKQANQGRQLVVKDPRSSWVTGLWAETAHSEGLGIGYLAMLRHPAEVIGSRTAYYAANRDAAGVRKYQVVKLAGWINTNLLVERQTRDMSRAFVRYDDLIDDWRTTMVRIRDEFELTYNVELQRDTAHELDSFIDPDLRRIRITWDDLDVPEPLSELAEEVWGACVALAEQPGDEKAQDRLDAAQEQYATLYSDAQAIAHDTIVGQRKVAVRNAKAKVRNEMQQEIAAAQADVRAANEQARAASRAQSQRTDLPRRIVRSARRRLRARRHVRD